MTVYRADFDGSQVACDPATLTRLAEGAGPVVVLVHGFKYSPFSTGHDPHSTLFAPRLNDPDHRLVSWPRRLRAGSGSGPDVLGFGWPARGSIWQVHDRAQAAGQALATLLSQIRRAAPHRPLLALGHSLGCRVVLSALERAPGVLDRVVLLAPAEYAVTAQAIATRSAKSRTQMLCVTSRENDLFDAMLEWAIAPPERGARMLGHGGLQTPLTANLQIDDATSLAALRHAGYRIAPPRRRICHWSVYNRPGAFSLYRAFLYGQVSAPTLRALLPDQTPPRWSRLMPHIPRRTPALEAEPLQP